MGFVRLVSWLRKIIYSKITTSCRIQEGLVISGSWEHLGYIKRLSVKDAEESLTRTMFANSIRADMVVADIGANLGLYTIVAAARVGSGGKVFAFEADPETSKWLARNVRLNHQEGIVTIENSAVGSQVGSTEFHINRYAPALGSRFIQNSVTEAIVVPMIDLSSYLDLVNIVKIDVEGGEADVLRGMERHLASGTCSRIFLELNPGILKSLGRSQAELIEPLVSQGYDLIAIDDIDCKLVRLEDLASDRTVNLMATRRH